MTRTLEQKMNGVLKKMNLGEIRRGFLTIYINLFLTLKLRPISHYLDLNLNLNLHQKERI